MKKIEVILIEDLMPYEDNPKNHPEKQILEIVDSIKRFGFTVPLIISGDGTIIAGHGRFLAAKRLGLKELPCIKRKDLSEEQARALRIMDNKLLESPWDLEILENEYFELEAMGYRLETVEEMIEVGAEILPAVEKEFNEEIAGEVNLHKCLECGYEFPK